MQRLFEDFKEHLRPVRDSTTKWIRTIHQVNHQKDPIIDKETQPRDTPIGILLSRGVFDLRVAKQRNPIRVRKIDPGLLSLRIPEHNHKRTKQPEHPEIRRGWKKDHIFFEDKWNVGNRRWPILPDDAPINER